MAHLNIAVVTEVLLELADRSEQERLWLSDGSDGSEISSPDEAINRLFTDSGLGRALEKAGDGIEPSWLAGTRELNRLTAKLDTCRSPIDVINDPEMDAIRALAARLLADVSQ